MSQNKSKKWLEYQKIDRMQNLTDRQRLDSLQALRALAFIGIFLSHADFFIAWSNLGVSVFFVLSGFLMEYNYKNMRNDALGLSYNLKFAWRRINKLYDLHIITMIFMIILSVDYIFRSDSGIRAVRMLGFQTACNIALVQTWIPYGIFPWSLNGVAWYLSAAMFLYFCFPWIRIIVDSKTTIKLCVFCVAIVIIQTLGCVLFIEIIGEKGIGYIWFMKFFPIFRLGDFFVGCTVSRVYADLNASLNDKKFMSFMEIGAIIFTVAVYLWCGCEHKSIIAKAYNNKTTPYIILAAIWVLLFALNKGIITRGLSNRVFLYIDNLSSYLFLIHYVVIEYIKRLFPKGNSTLFGEIMMILASFIVSIIISEGWKLIHKRNLSTLIQSE